jgi:hypothetical protein
MFFEIFLYRLFKKIVNCFFTKKRILNYKMGVKNVQVALAVLSFLISVAYGQSCSGLNYFVRSGDTLASLLNSFSYTGVTFATMVNANPTVNFNVANLAASYQIICIPLSNSATATTLSPFFTTTTAQLSCQGLYYQVRPIDTTSSIINTFAIYGVSQATLSSANPNINFNAANLTASYPGQLFICVPLSSTVNPTFGFTTATTTRPFSVYPYNTCLRISVVQLAENCNSIISRLGVTEATLNFCNGVPFCYNLVAGQLIRY